MDAYETRSTRWPEPPPRNIRVKNYEASAEEIEEDAWVRALLTEDESTPPARRAAPIAKQRQIGSRHKEMKEEKELQLRIERLNSSEELGLRRKRQEATQRADITEGEHRRLQEQAIIYYLLLDTSEARKSLRVGTQGVTVETLNPITGKHDIVYVKGITELLREQFYPDATYHAAVTDPRKIPGALHTFSESDTDRLYAHERRRVDGQMPPIIDNSMNRKIVMDGSDENSGSAKSKSGPGMSFTAVHFNALKRGSDAHKKMELYSKAYMYTIKHDDCKTDKVLENYQAQIEINGLENGGSPDVRTILSVYAMPEYQFIPVAAEVPVYNTKQVERYFRERKDASDARARANGTALGSGSSSRGPMRGNYRGFGKRTSAPVTSPFFDTVSNRGNAGGPRSRVFGTLLDAVVLAPHLDNNLAILEFKITTGSFTASSGRMQEPLDFLENSAQNQAIVQVTLGIEYFKRTYTDQIKESEILDGYKTDSIHGFVISTPPTGGHVIVKHVSPELQRKIIHALKTTEFLM